MPCYIDVDDDGYTVIERIARFAQRHGPFLEPPAKRPPPPPDGVPAAYASVTSHRIVALAYDCPHCGDAHEAGPTYGLTECPATGRPVYIYGRLDDATEELRGVSVDIRSARAVERLAPATLRFDCPHCKAWLHDHPDEPYTDFNDFLDRLNTAHEVDGDYGLHTCARHGKPVWLQWRRTMASQTEPTIPDSRFDSVEDWRMRLQRFNDKKLKNGTVIQGGPRGNLHNALLAFRYAPQWHNVLAFNEFTQTVEITKAPPWMTEKERLSFKPCVLSDHLVTEAQSWIQRQDIQVTSQTTLAAMVLVAHDRDYHPVRGWLSVLKWDGVPRLDTWLIDHAGAPDNEYVRTVSRCFLIAMVARIFEPGVKADCALILEGPQGLKKSSLLDALADPWFCDFLPADLGNKDSMIQMLGAWLIEISEMASFKASDVDKVKRFMSARQDQYRPPYGKTPVKIQRQTVFAGTINPGGGGYLKDETGDRRWWPVLCGVDWDAGRRIDVDAFKEERELLLAEAVIQYREGAAWWLEEHRLEEQAAAETDARFDHDVWTQDVLAYATNRPEVTSIDVLKDALEMKPKECDTKAQMRVGTILRKAGWKKGRRMVNGIQANRYTNPRWKAESADNVVELNATKAPTETAKTAEQPNSRPLDGLWE